MIWIMNLLLYFVAIFGLASASPLIRLAQAPLEVIGFWRLVLCALCFLPFAVKGSRLWRDPNRNWALTCGVLFFLHLWAFFFATQNTTIANSMILYSTNPLFTALGAFLFFHEKLPRRVIPAYILAFIGIYQLVRHNLNFAPAHLPGDAMALLSGIFLSAYILTGHQARKTLSNWHFSFLVYSVTGMLFGLTGLARGEEFFNYPSVTWLSIIGLVIFPTLLGHVLFMYLLRHLNINFMSCGKLLEPAIASVAALWLFNEELKSETWVAFVFTGAAVLILLIPWQNVRWLRRSLESDE